MGNIAKAEETSGPVLYAERSKMVKGFEKPALGDVVAVDAVDWSLITGEHDRGAGFSIVRGRLFGEVIVVNDEWITLAPQVFSAGGVRCALSIPWVTIMRVVILEKAGTWKGKDW